MGPFGIPWLTVIVEVIAIPIMIIISIIIVKSKWWREKSDYYFSWNEEE